MPRSLLRYTITDTEGEVYVTGELWNERQFTSATDAEGDELDFRDLVDDAERWALAKQTKGSAMPRSLDKSFRDD